MRVELFWWHKKAEAKRNKPKSTLALIKELKIKKRKKDGYPNGCQWMNKESWTIVKCDIRVAENGGPI